MADQINPFALLNQLETMDVQEDHLLAQLLQRGAALEESERRGRMVTVAELHALRSGLTSLEAAIDALQEGVARAEAAAVAQKPANGNGAPKAYEAPAPATPVPPDPEPAVPEPPPTFDELAARIRDHDAAGARLRTMLRERFAALDKEAATLVPPVTAPVPDPGGPARPTFRLTPKPHMRSAEIRDFQDMLNHRFERWEIGLRVPEDGVYGRTTRDAARRVARGLGIAAQDYAHGFTPAVRDLMRNPSGRTAEQLGRAQDRAAWLAALRRKYPAGGAAAHGGAHAHAHAHAGGGQRRTGHVRRASVRKMPAHKRSVTAKPSRKAAAGELEAAIRKFGGRYEDIIVRECRKQGVSVSLICAVIEMESGFRNVFGHDPVPNPIKSPRGGFLAVTESNYHEYLRRRNRGEGAQGVGPMQLTFPPFQDSADKLGGCWKVGPNIRVGVAQLARNIKASGTHAALVIYNGSESYADAVLKLERKWRERLAGLSAGPGGGGGGTTKPYAPSQPAPHAPRIYRVRPKLMSGSDIRRFQELLNHRMGRWGIDLRIEEDGIYGPATKLMARRVARALGIDPADHARGITPATRSVIRDPRRRTPTQIARARSNRPWKLALKKRHAIAGGGKPGSIKGDGSYPLAKRGKFNGGPYQGTHRKGNWQSDNAVDLNTPVGTAMLSMDDGKVEKVFHRPQDGSGFAGDQITIRGDHGNWFFYTHGVASVKAGQRVHRGQVLGTTGSASGVAHLHFAIKKGDPRQLIGQYK